MPTAVARSKSLGLRRSQKDSATTAQVSQPRYIGSDAEYRNDLHFLPKHSPKRADSGFSAVDEMARPRTANSTKERKHALHIKGAPIVVTADNQTYDFPTPSPTAIMEARELRGEQTIGMALGSPTSHSRSPTRGSSSAAVRNTGTNLASVTNADSLAGLPTPQTAKPKHSRWKSIFGRKLSVPPPQQPAPDSDQKAATRSSKETHSKGTSKAHANAPSAGSPARKASSRKQQGTRDIKATKQSQEASRGRPELPRNRSEIPSSASVSKPRNSKDKPIGLRKPNPPPLNMSQSRPNQSSGRSPALPPKDRSVSSPTISNFHMAALEKLETPEWPRPSTDGSPVTSPMLDVDIPKVELERYSVMFSSLLNPNRQSIYIRRQGTQQRLKPLNEDSLKRADMTLSKNEAADHDDRQLDEPLLSPKFQRRATSPATPTFSLSLFPSARNSASPRIGHNNDAFLARASSPLRPPPPKRNNTAPMILSPSQPTFFASSRAAKAHVRASKLTEELSHPSRPTSPPRASFDSASTVPGDDSDDDNDSGCDNDDEANPITPKPSTDWEMLNPSPSPPLSRSTIEPAPACLRGPVNLKQRAEEVQQAARMAIARQVSLSRQQAEKDAQRREWLLSRSNSRGERSGSGGNGGNGKGRKGSEERFGIGVMRVGTPTIVEMGERRSVAVQIMDA